jgi:hypothetical protein
MSMLLFMPWCAIDKTYEGGEITILPFKRHEPINGLSEAGECQVNTIISTYKSIEGKPITDAAIVRYGNKAISEDLSENEIEAVYELVGLMCFCSLADRSYFNQLGRYCNSDCFLLYVQKFKKPDFVALTTRRREGQTISTWSIDDITITAPVHIHPINHIDIKEQLLNALIAQRSAMTEEWAKWQNAINCFNQANTDSENVRYQIEWVLLASAFEHILSAKSDARDVVRRFSETMVPDESLLAQEANRSSTRWQDNGQALRYEWMREFYRIRGDFAHGRLMTQQPAVWHPLEHLVLATIAFPLLVKCLLRGFGNYQLTDDDQAQIDALEMFSDTRDFLKPPQDQKNSLDSHWKRILDERKSNLIR